MPVTTATGALSIDSVYNLIRDATGCELPPDPMTFKLNQDPELGPLASNGGPHPDACSLCGQPGD